MLNIGAYNSYIQNHLVQAEYWHDPFNEPEYKRKSVFLADINNEKNEDTVYKDNLVKLENMVLVMFEQDTEVIPKESEWFGFYTEGQDKDITYMRNTTLYSEDRIGLKELDSNGRLQLLGTQGDHLQIDETWFAENIIEPYIKTNTTTSL
jgi:palmitoyl-protein thioesterase